MTSAELWEFPEKYQWGFENIRLYFDLHADAHQNIESLAKLTERYCVVYQTLSNALISKYHEIISLFLFIKNPPKEAGVIVKN